MTYITIERAPRFEINEAGDIRNKKTKRVLKTSMTDGYPCVTVGLHEGRGSKQVKLRVHVEKAKAFLPNPHGYPVVMHLDDDRTNHDLVNLQWGTQKSNMEHSSSAGGHSKYRKEVTLVSPEGIKVDVCGLRVFCADNDLDWGNFSKMIKGQRKSVKGWKLYEQQS